MADIKTVRCTDCYSEFSDADVVGRNTCPICQTHSLPMHIGQDVTIKINWHELRILTIWAENWARTECDQKAVKTLLGIIRRLEAQRPDETFSPLTLRGELQELVDKGLIKDATLHQGGDVEEFKEAIKH